MSRDFAAEMRALMEAERGGPDFDKAVARDNLVEKLRATDGELWFGWLDLVGPDTVWEHLDRLDRSARAKAIASAQRHTFAAAAEEHAKGNPEPLRQFLDMPIQVGGTSKPLYSLYATDVWTAKQSYDARARDNRLKGALLGAIYKKLGSRSVGDVYTEEQLHTMWRSIGGLEAQ